MKEKQGRGFVFQAQIHQSRFLKALRKVSGESADMNQHQQDLSMELEAVLCPKEKGRGQWESQRS